MKSKAITPTEFELLTKKLFSDRLKKSFGIDIQVDHQSLFKTHGGNYKVDLSYSFTVFDKPFLTLVECKYWNNSVSREKVGYFKSILDEVGTRKGIIVTTRGFQKGAITYAQRHNIGLIKITNDKYFDEWSHFDGAINLLSDKINRGKPLNPDESYTSYGLFTPSVSVNQFVADHYGKELLKIFEDEPDAKINADILDQLLKIPSNWYEVYSLIETAGLNYKLKNEPEMRLLNMMLFMLRHKISL